MFSNELTFIVPGHRCNKVYFYPRSIGVLMLHAA